MDDIEVIPVTRPERIIPVVDIEEDEDIALIQDAQRRPNVELDLTTAGDSRQSREDGECSDVEEQVECVEVNRNSMDCNGVLNSGNFIDYHGEVPWVNPAKPFSLPGIVGLHEEVEACYNWLKATDAENYVRRCAVLELRAILQEVWPDLRMEIMGSASTGLCLPSSDVDLVFFGAWEYTPLFTVAEILHKKGFCDPTLTNIVATARVPIVKVTHKSTETRIDISFNQMDGLTTSELVWKYSKQFSGFKKVYLVVKQLLVSRDLNECFYGGLSSFSLVLLLVHFFQTTEKNGSGRRTNLGVLLLEFFEYYSFRFDYVRSGIDVKNDTEILKPFENASSLLIMSPVRKDQVAASTTLFRCITKLFEWCFATLSKAVNPSTCIPEEICEKARFQGVLWKLFQVDEEIIQWRRNVQEMYDKDVFGMKSKFSAEAGISS